MITISRNIIGLGLSSLLIAGTAFAQQNNFDASFLLTEESESIALDVVVDNPKVTVFDLMIPVGSFKKTDALLDSCTSGIKGSHAGGCNIVNGEFRMVVFSPQNATLGSGRVGTFVLPNIAFDHSDIRIRAYDAQGAELNVEVLADFEQVRQRHGMDRDSKRYESLNKDQIN